MKAPPLESSLNRWESVQLYGERYLVGLWNLSEMYANLIFYANHSIPHNPTKQTIRINGNNAYLHTMKDFVAPTVADKENAGILPIRP